MMIGGSMLVAPAAFAEQPSSEVPAEQAGAPQEAVAQDPPVAPEEAVSADPSKGDPAGSAGNAGAEEEAVAEPVEAPAPVGPDPADASGAPVVQSTRPVTGGTLSWGFRESWRNYV
ncbi:hypothetical protein D1J51_17595, partial [Leucobacter sp. wl10]